MQSYSQSPEMNNWLILRSERIAAAVGLFLKVDVQVDARHGDSQSLFDPSLGPERLDSTLVLVFTWSGWSPEPDIRPEIRQLVPVTVWVGVVCLFAMRLMTSGSRSSPLLQSESV